MTTPKSWHDANRKALGLPPDWGAAVRAYRYRLPWLISREDAEDLGIDPIFPPDGVIVLTRYPRDPE